MTSSRPTSVRRRFLLGLGALVFASAVVLIIGEMGVRVFFPHSRDHVVPSGLFEIDGDVGWKLRVGGGDRHKTRYFDVEYAVNALGFRDVERSLDRSPRTRRVLVYGDSEVFGWGIPLGERFTDLVEAELPGVELWNLAVPGYGIGQELIAYETSGERYDGDEVILFATPPVFYRSHFGYLYRKPKPRFALDATGGLRVDSVEADSRSLSDRFYRLLSPFYLPYFVDQRLQRLRHRIYDMKTPTAPPFDEVVEQILLRGKDLASRRGDRLTVLAHFDDPETRRDLADFASRNGIGFLSIGMDDSEEGLVFGPYDQHWNGRANRIVAEEILGQIQGHGM